MMDMPEIVILVVIGACIGAAMLGLVYAVGRIAAADEIAARERERWR